MKRLSENVVSELTCEHWRLSDLAKQQFPPLQIQPSISNTSRSHDTMPKLAYKAEAVISLQLTLIEPSSACLEPGDCRGED